MMKRAGVQFIAAPILPTLISFPGFSLHEELSLLVQAGFTPMEALQSATRTPQSISAAFDSAGTIEVGKRGRSGLLNANPLTEIGNTRKIDCCGGFRRFLPRQELDKMLADVEAAVSKRK